MKIKTLAILSVLFTSLVLFSCEDKNESDDHDPSKPSESDTDDVYTNKWIYGEMQKLYLWSDQLPANPDFKQDPENFLKSIRYKVGEIDGDRFTSMSKDVAKARTAANYIGFEIQPNYYFDLNVSKERLNVGFFVTHVHKSSNAEQKGLERGHVIYAVNNTLVTYDNYEYLYDLIKSSSSLSVSVYNKEGNKIGINNITGFSYDKQDPIWLAKVIDVNGLKVGYIVYNQFEKGDDNKYDIRFANIIDSMTNKVGVKNIVLDLRYNPGGYLISATHMASALVPDRNSRNIFQKLAYNHTKHAELSETYGNTYLFKDNINENFSIPRTNLNSLYVLATKNTASASESIINGLKPYMNVIQIGTTTVGKDKGSWELRSESSKVKWTYNPLIFRVVNKDDNKLTGGNYENGLIPDIEIDELKEGYPTINATNGNSFPNLSSRKNWKGLIELGDTSEPLLAEAIAHITGSMRKRSSVEDTYTRIISANVPKLEQLVPHLMIVNPEDLIEE